jgi:glycosyltransferase involved in cell wall biosynthesis
MADLAVVVVTYNALPYIEQCLQSVAGWETVVVDHGSKDGTVALVEERFHDVPAAAGKPRPRGRLEPRHPRDVEPVRPDPERGRVGGR